MRVASVGQGCVSMSQLQFGTRTPNKDTRRSESAPQTPAKNAMKYICKKGRVPSRTFLGSSGCQCIRVHVAHYVAVLQYPRGRKGALRRWVAFGDLAQIEALRSRCATGSRGDRNLRGLNRCVDCTHFRPWPTMGTQASTAPEMASSSRPGTETRTVLEL